MTHAFPDARAQDARLGFFVAWTVGSKSSTAFSLTSRGHECSAVTLISLIKMGGAPPTSQAGRSAVAAKTRARSRDNVQDVAKEYFSSSSARPSTRRRRRLKWNFDASSEPKCFSKAERMPGSSERSPRNPATRMRAILVNSAVERSRPTEQRRSAIRSSLIHPSHDPS